MLLWNMRISSRRWTRLNNKLNFWRQFLPLCQCKFWGFFNYLWTICIWASVLAQIVKNLPVIWENQIPSLDQEDPVEKGKATHSNILPWRIPWTENPGKLQSMGLQKVGRDWTTFTFFFLSPHIFFTQYTLTNPLWIKFSAFILVNFVE